MTARILVVEDEELIAAAVRFALRRDGFEVDVAHDGPTALRLAAERPPELVLLDVVLPGGVSGHDVCREIRAVSSVPIILVTARDTEADVVLGLERGADDYVLKPFSMAELVARVRAHLRRRDLDRSEVTQPLRSVGAISVDLLRREAFVDGRQVHLTPSEFAVLALLAERPGHVVSREEIVSQLWASDFVGDMRTCDAHVRRLRRKIEPDPRNPRRLVSVRGAGYKLVSDTG